MKQQILKNSLVSMCIYMCWHIRVFSDCLGTIFVTIGHFCKALHTNHKTLHQTNKTLYISCKSKQFLQNSSSSLKKSVFASIQYAENHHLNKHTKHQLLTDNFQCAGHSSFQKSCVIRVINTHTHRYPNV